MVVSLMKNEVRRIGILIVHEKYALQSLSNSYTTGRRDMH